MLNCINTQNSITKGDFERVVTFRFPSGSRLPEAAGSSIVRPKLPKKEKLNFDWARQLRGETDPDLLSDIVVDPDGSLESVPAQQKVMSNRSARKIRNKIHAMYRAGIAKSFLTLTFVSAVTDRVAVRCLQKLFKLWRDRWGKFNFLWVAERQDNKNLHFHVILDRYVNVSKENSRWARLQYNSGIIYKTDRIIRLKKNHDKIKSSLGIFLKDVKNVPGQLDKAEYILNHEIEVNPNNLTPEQVQFWLNPLDIEKINSVNQLASYLASYVTKKIGEKYDCQTWNCSKGVSALFTELMLPTEIHELCIDDKIETGKNIYTYKCDVYRKGKLKYKKGDVILPVNKFNDYSYWVYIKNFDFANTWLNQLDELNKYVLRGIVNDDDIIRLDYDEYCKRYQLARFRNYRALMKTFFNRENSDCIYRSDFDKRKLDIENDFFQLGKAYKKFGLLAMYSENPRYDYRGKRWYGNKELTPDEMDKINHYLTIKKTQNERLSN